jgi:Cu2+-exporting ATPase
MTCDGCSTKVEKTLNGIVGIEAKVSLNPPIATITMEKHIPTAQLQEELTAVGKYTIEIINGKIPQEVATNKTTTKSCCTAPSHSDKQEIKVPLNANGKYYCPMHCEGDKNYDKAGDCPVCGMDLVREQLPLRGAGGYTCPMHPEIIQDHSGSCPICGMDLVPLNQSDSDDQKPIKICSRK